MLESESLTPKQKASLAKDFSVAIKNRVRGACEDAHAQSSQDAEYILSELESGDLVRISDAKKRIHDHKTAYSRGSGSSGAVLTRLAAQGLDTF